MKSYLLAFCVLFWVGLCFGQESDHFSFNGNYVTFGLSLPIVKYLDKGHSPNLYKGRSGLMITGSFFSATPQLRSKISFSYIFCSLSNRRKEIPYPSNSAYSNFVVKYSLGFRAYDEHNLGYYLGPSLLVGFANNQYENLKSNNAFAFEGKISLGLEGEGLFRLVAKPKQLVLTTNHNLSLLTWSCRPNWTTMMPFDGIQPKFSPLRLLSGGRLVTFNKFFDVQQQIGLLLRNENTRNFIGAQHQYYYSRNLSAPHNLYTGLQSIGLIGGLIYR